MLKRLDPFRDEALKRGIPPADVDRWIAAGARPCATLSLDGDGPIVGQAGGPLALPAGVPDPWYPLVATIDCAAVPKAATDLPLPDDGRLLLFGFPDGVSDFEPGGGSVVYIPSGTEAEERAEDPDFLGDEYTREVREQYPQGRLHLTANVCLPTYGLVEIPEHPYTKPLPGHPRSEELCEVWDDVAGEVMSHGVMQIGGYANDEYRGEQVEHLALPPDLSDGWALLVDWHTDIRGREGATIHWGIRREDLAGRRFDKVSAEVFWNP